MSTTKQDVILDAAENLFAQNGFNGTTTRAIAGTAGVNIAMLSYYFGSKKQLLHAVIERFSNRLVQEFHKINEIEKDPASKLRNWITAYIDYIFDHPNHARIVYRQVSVSQERDDIIKLVSEFNKIRAIVLQTMEAGIEAGVFNNIDTQLAISSITAPVNAIVLEANIHKERFGLESENGKLFPDSFRDRVKSHMLEVFESMLLK